MLNAGQEEIVFHLRTHLRLSLGGLPAVVRDVIEPAMSCSALDQLLCRRGVNRLPEPEVIAAQGSFLNALHNAAPFKVKRLLTYNGREFTDRAFGRREKDASGEHEFDALCPAWASSID